jgi:hypothetical protein
MYGKVHPRSIVPQQKDFVPPTIVRHPLKIPLRRFVVVYDVSIAQANYIPRIQQPEA